ncbi:MULTISPECIES: hypothetical protein [unclassified Enterococcus]|uniref:hypothetical protein n=1 Tax=unclassified Enterococcus TaxID=2608891 RepID=UPI002475B546|nr:MULTISPECIES: hypothetical protein [unclassified Enterococcus]
MKFKCYLLLIGVLCTLSGCVHFNFRVTKHLSPESSETADSIEIVEEADVIYIDEIDSEIWESIVLQVCQLQSIKREQMKIEIFTSEDYRNREVWVAKCTLENYEKTYFYYDKASSKVKQISEADYKKELAIVTTLNVQPEIPLYEENHLK